MRISDWSSDVCSSDLTSRKGNTYGMVGMAIAILTTIANLGDLSGTIVFVVIALVIGGSIGAVLARRIQMTAMPQLVAAMHSLVGLAAVLVAAAAFYNPEPYGILHDGEIGRAHVELQSLMRNP